MTLGTNAPQPRSRRTSPDDSADATALLKLGAPLACPTCGSHTRPAETREGWVCLDSACVWS